MVVAVATFNESALPSIGIFTFRSAFSSHKEERPYCSEPMTIAKGFSKFSSVYTLFAPGEVATIFIFCSFKNDKTVLASDSKMF